MPQKNEPDFETMSLDEIRALAEQEANGEVPAAPAAAEEEPEVPEKEEEVPEKEEPEEIVLREEIDLGDGAGVQVFEGRGKSELDAYRQLTSNLKQAQLNATKKIREQAAQLRERQQKEQEEAAQTDADQEFVLSQEMMSNPSKAVEKIFKKMTGLDINDLKTVKQRADAWESAQQTQVAEQAKHEAAEAFMGEHPEYVANQRNGARLTRAVELLEKEYRSKGQEINYGTLLSKAYDDLKEGGLLELKAASDVTTAKQEPAKSGNQRIAEPVEATPAQRRKGSGLPGTSRVPAPVKNQGPNEEELYKMPLDKLRELAESN